MCFINQKNAGDEWLTIRDDVDFESITANAFQYEKFRDFLECIFKATEEQLLEYSTDEYKRKWKFFYLRNKNCGRLKNVSWLCAVIFFRIRIYDLVQSIL
jgi:hypothetical protein